MRISIPALAVGLSLAAAGLAWAQAPAIKAEMKAAVEPASNVLFAVGGEVDPANGADAKASDARWAEAADAAAKLKAVAADLQAPGQAKDPGDWMTYAKQLGDISDASLKAAQAKDGAGLSTAANALGDNCSACHGKYKPKT